MQAKSSEFRVNNLNELERVALALRRLAIVLPDGFTTAEKQVWRWVQDCCYAPGIVLECRNLSAARADEIARLFASIDNILERTAEEEAHTSSQQPTFAFADQDEAA